MLELAYISVLDTDARKGLGVRLPLPAPNYIKNGGNNMSVIGKMTKRRSTIPMNMVTKVKKSKKEYNRKKDKRKIKRDMKKYA